MTPWGLRMNISSMPTNKQRIPPMQHENYIWLLLALSGYLLNYSTRSPRHQTFSIKRYIPCWRQLEWNHLNVTWYIAPTLDGIYSIYSSLLPEAGTTRLFADDIYKLIFFTKNTRTLIPIALKFVFEYRFNKIIVGTSTDFSSNRYSNLVRWLELSMLLQH